MNHVSFYGNKASIAIGKIFSYFAGGCIWCRFKWSAVALPFSPRVDYDPPTLQRSVNYPGHCNWIMQAFHDRNYGVGKILSYCAHVLIINGYKTQWILPSCILINSIYMFNVESIQFVREIWSQVEVLCHFLLFSPTFSLILFTCDVNL